MKVDRLASAETTQKIHIEYSDMFTVIGCFKGTFSLQVKDDAKPYQTLPRCIVNVLQEPFKKSWKDSKYWCHWEKTKQYNGATAWT